MFTASNHQCVYLVESANKEKRVRAAGEKLCSEVYFEDMIIQILFPEWRKLIENVTQNEFISYTFIVWKLVKMLLFCLFFSHFLVKRNSITVYRIMKI